MVSDGQNAPAATIQVWAKGFRVSERSEEFQLVVPADLEALGPEERALQQVSWGEALQPMYRLKPPALMREFALVLHESSVTLAVAAHSEDKRGRTSIVVIAGTVPVEWASEDLRRRGGATRSLVSRLAQTYAGVLSGSPSGIQSQLQDGRFISNRAFDLGAEEEDSSVVWASVAREVKRWKGIRGVATKHFLPLGANVLYGTRDEAERNRSSTKPIDGYFDIARGEMVPVTAELTLWPTQPAQVDETETKARTGESESYGEIRRRLEVVVDQNERTHGLLESLIELVRDLFEGERRRVKKK